MKHQKISIVTPSYNQGKYLEQTIDAVLSQGYPNLEYFVVDGGSNDQSVAIIKKYAKHLKWWVSEEDKGQSHAINKGMARATGDIFNWINSDDYYEPGALKTVNEVFQNDDISMASFRANVFGLQNRTSRGTDIFPNNLPKALAYSRIDQPETFFKMDAVHKMGPLNENLHYCMDKEWLLRYFLLFGNKNALNRDEVILNFRYHDTSKSVSQLACFEIEADHIYRCLAKDNEELSTLISDVLLLGNVDSNLELNELPTETIESSIINTALHYYLYKRFIEKYETLDFDSCRILSASIQPESLSSDDRKRFSTLSKRSHFFSPQAIKLLRKVLR